MLRSLRRCLRAGLAAMLLLIPCRAAAQQEAPASRGTALPPSHDALVHRDGEAAPVMEKVRARMEWRYQRLSWPHGEIPEGARVRAHERVRREMPQYTSARRTTSAALEWRNVGPVNIGGRILSVAVNPLNPAVIYIGAADGGVWKTFDEGRTWRSMSESFPTQAMGAIAIDPVDTSIVYAGTGEANYSTQRMFDGGGMFRSTDGGETWSEIGSGTIPPYARASSILIHPFDRTVLYAAIPDGVRNADSAGLYKSTDAGSTWRLLLAGRMNDVVFDPRNPDVLYTHASVVFEGGTSRSQGMYKSTDGGATWSQLDVGVPPETHGRTSIAISRSNPDVLYLGMSRIAGSGRTWLLGVFKTTDAGASWTRLEVPFDYMVSQGWYDNIMGVHPDDPDIVYAGGVKLIRSSDGGRTWTRIPDQGFGGILHVDQHAIAFNPQNPDRVYIGNDGGFYVGTDQGRAWEKRDLGLSITQFVGGAMHPTRDDVLLGGTQDNGTMVSAGPPRWNHVLYGDGGNGAINPQSPNILFTTKENLKFWRSEDYGRTWTEAMGGLPAEGSLFYIEYDMDLRNPSTLYLGTYRLYKTTTDGRSWRTLQSCPFTSASGGCYYITAVSVAPYNSDVVLAAAAGQVAVSTNAGETWTIVRDKLPLGYCSSIRSFQPGVLYATFSTYGLPKVWRSSDNGATWSDISTTLPDIPVNDIIDLDGTLVIGTELGCFASDDGGATWQRFGTGLPALSVEKLRYNARTGTVRAITHGRGMYDLTWKAQPLAAPVFLSERRDTLIDAQRFTYAPVVAANPPASFTLDEPAPGVELDPVLGMVQWFAAPGARVTIVLRAVNAEGSAVQRFTVEARARAADWEVVSSTPFPSTVTALRRAADGSLWAARDSSGVSISTDEGRTWTHRAVPSGNASVYGLHAFDAQRAVAGTRAGRLFLTSDGGASWTETYFDQNARFGNIHFIDADNGLALSPGAFDSTDVYRSTDGGRSWTRSTDPRSWARFPIDNTLLFHDGLTGWYASSNFEKSPPEDAVILRTLDGGRSWQSRTAGTRGVSSISFATALKGYAVDEVQGRVRRTQSGGVSWSTTFFPMNGLRNVSVHAQRSGNSVWIVSDTSAWYSPNDGASWQRTQLVPVGSMEGAVFADSVTGWAISQHGVVQRIRAIPTGAAAVPVPDVVSLDPVWPNPVAGSADAATASFTLGRAVPVRLRVHNSAGQTVATLLDGAVLPAGTHMSVWDAAAVPNGVYFLVLEADGAVRTAPVVRTR